MLLSRSISAGAPTTFSDLDTIAGLKSRSNLKEGSF